MVSMMMDNSRVMQGRPGAQQKWAVAGAGSRLRRTNRSSRLFGALLPEWNRACPPWAEHELLDKICRPRRYGREPIAGRLRTALRSVWIVHGSIGWPRAHNPTRIKPLKKGFPFAFYVCVFTDART